MYRVIGILLILCSITEARVITSVTVTMKSPTLTWNNEGSLPDKFIIRRKWNDASWRDVATIPGVQGRGITWIDTNIPDSSTKTLLFYEVIAVVGRRRSPASNRVTMTLPPNIFVPSVPCVLDEVLVITCTTP